ncbi:chromosomal replication initiator protein DnaA [Pelagerythrobacter marinus]|jgi:chromosomal replication initiator protein|uniref:chromosomal replication initiator protein DnaA n=1 Tax=Pelagerythrobacter marinus TaxID=538382 RepID=UPI002036C3A4|nr:chromosomal replication initiator protein DnaA [Pelagerythrobacter marinus]MEC9066896.1 chromosomal replication initiator protein DnaA [Pseudomonadota bacterium]USA39584.1 chromosomal replication initiator protein DnaA [Pelagerythrobacter marinus]WPZ06243.1 chromosomal replication initiator protein DnaA [Pelagerythrobacter marinus]
MASKVGEANARAGKGQEESMEDLEAVNLAADWSDISQGLRKDLGHQLHSQWIKPIQLGGFCKDTGTLDLYLPTEFSANWVQDRFADRLSLAWKIARSEVRNVRISVHPGRRKLPELSLGGDSHRPANDADSSMIAVAAGTIGEQGFTSSVGLDPSLTFAAFVTGESNVLACNAAQRMAASEKPQFSPLYLKAATGQGKTHLLHAIGHAYLSSHPRARIFYCSAERFMVEFVQALKQNQMIEFKARLRSFDLLLVDDIQFIIGKASAQEELLYTIDALLAEGKRLVFAADRAPQALDGVEPRLLSRLSMGLVADIAPADIELRRSILESKLTRFAPLSVPEDVIDFLARTITRNVRELVGGLNKLIAYAQLTGQEVSLQLAEEQLTDILSANRRRITIDEIQRTVCQFYRIDRAEMSSKRRARAVVRPRQVAMYLSKVLTPRSYPEIGRKFGGRDHSTVIHAVRLIEDLRQRDADMDGDVRSLLRQLES